MSNRSKRPRVYICSFCGKNSNQVDTIVTGPDVFICNECVSTASQIIRENSTKRLAKMQEEFPRPEEIKEELDAYVIG